MYIETQGPFLPVNTAIAKITVMKMKLLERALLIVLVSTGIVTAKTVIKSY